MGNTSPKTAIISGLDNSNKKIQSSSVSLKEQSASSTKDDDIAMIDIDIYFIACYSKKAQIFDISLKNL